LGFGGWDLGFGFGIIQTVAAGFSRPIGIAYVGAAFRRPIRRKEKIRRREDSLAPQRANAGLVQHRVVTSDTCRLALLVDDLRHPAALDTIRVVHVGDRRQKSLAVLGGNLLEEAPVHGNSLEQRRNLGESRPVHRISLTGWS